MIGHGTGKPVSEVGMGRVEGQKRHHRPVEIFDVFGPGLVAASGIGLLAFGIALGGSLGFEFGTNLVDGNSRSLPNTTPPIVRHRCRWRDPCFC